MRFHQVFWMLEAKPSAKITHAKNGAVQPLSAPPFLCLAFRRHAAIAPASTIRANGAEPYTAL